MERKPNVVIFYADDLGYGDLSCCGSAELKTPNVDRLCENGRRFTDAYAASAVCTPSRYGLLTGQYPFRENDLRILQGDAKCVIGKDRTTLPKVFQNAGYATAVVGKWHLGLGDGAAPIDWSRDIPHTPLDVGFDESFIFPATADRVPCVFVDGRAVVGRDENDPIEVSYKYSKPFEGLPTAANNPELLKMRASHGHDMAIINGIGRIGYMRGGEKALWRDEDLAEAFLNRAKSFVHNNKDKPFFLYYALHQPHVPRVPSPRFAGVTGLGARGDVIAEMDWCVGELTNTLKELELLQDTIVIFSSDNGPVLDDGYRDRAVELNGMHRPAGPLRGGKYSKFEGGTRIPFIVSWQNTIKDGVSKALVSQVDLLRSFAALLDVAVPDGQAKDSLDLAGALFKDDPKGREDVLFEEAWHGKALRRGKWVYLPPDEGTSYIPETGIETGLSLDRQLYNLDYDIGQRDNLAWRYPDIADDMDDRITEIVNS